MDPKGVADIFTDAFLGLDTSVTPCNRQTSSDSTEEDHHQNIMNDGLPDSDMSDADKKKESKKDCPKPDSDMSDADKKKESKKGFSRPETIRPGDEKSGNTDGRDINPGKETNNHQNPGVKVLRVPTYTWTGESKKGLAVVIGIDKFDDDKIKNMEAMKTDQELVEKMFESIKFDIAKVTGKTKNEITTDLQNIAKSNDTSYDCFAFYVSSHGSNGYVCCKDSKYETNEGDIAISHIIKLFLNGNCKRFEGKPKLFFFDVCLGPNEQKTKGNAGKKSLSKFKTEEEKTEAYKHIFVGYATIEGYVAYGDEDGSRFTKILAESIKISEKKHTIEQICSAVYGEMEEKKDDEDCRQTPKFANKLVKQLYLKEE